MSRNVGSKGGKGSNWRVRRVFQEWRNLHIQRKTAFLRFPPVHWANLEGQQSVGGRAPSDLRSSQKGGERPYKGRLWKAGVWAKAGIPVIARNRVYRRHIGCTDTLLSFVLSYATIQLWRLQAPLPEREVGTLR